MLTLAKFLVWTTGIAFCIYGLLFTLFPHHMAELITHSVHTSTAAVVDTRATYGGMSFAVGLAILTTIYYDSSYKLPLLVVVTVLMSMAAGRLLGMILDGGGNGIMVALLISEVVPSIIALWLIRTIK